MIDYFKGKMEILLPQQMMNQELGFITFLGLRFHSVLFNEGNVVYYKANFENLKLTIIGTTLFIENSLWKYYHRNNYQPFTYSDLVKAIEQLENQLQIDVDKLEVIKLEYGIVVNTDDVNLSFNDFGKYKLYSPNNMTKNGRIYGVFYQNTTHKIKIYDKKFEAKREGHQLPNELLRIEKKCYLKPLNRTRNFNGITAYNLGDFKKTEVVEALYNDLVDTLKKIEIRDTEFLSELSPKELRILSSMDNPEIREEMKRNHLPTYKSDRIIFEKIKKNPTNKKYSNFLLILEEQKSILFQPCSLVKKKAGFKINKDTYK